MRTSNDRAFKEWAVACEAMRRGEQILLIRKGGIREEGGEFVINDREFFLMPTFEHQNRELLRPEIVPLLDELETRPRVPPVILIDTYAVVESIAVAKNEEQVAPLLNECIWNERYVKLRFDFNPYDPLYLLTLRAYILPEPVEVAMRPEYEGCKSWVTLDSPISTAGAVPAIGDHAFAERSDRIRAGTPSPRKSSLIVSHRAPPPKKPGRGE